MIKNQNGIGLINLIIGIAVIGFVGIFGFQIGVGYMDRNIIKKTMTTVLLESKSNDATISSIKRSIRERVNVNNIDLGNDDIVVTKSGSGFEIQISYAKTIKINNDLSLSMNFLLEDATP